MREGGRYLDPFGHHEAPWISDGSPTALVRDGRIESHDPPSLTCDVGTLRALPDISDADRDDLVRADDAKPENPSASVWSVVNAFDQTRWPISH